MKKFLKRCILEITETISVILSVLAYLAIALLICGFFNWGPTGFMVVLMTLFGPCIGTFMSITDYFYKLKCRWGCFYS